jgi:hypothetical protein
MKNSQKIICNRASSRKKITCSKMTATNCFHNCVENKNMTTKSCPGNFLNDCKGYLYSKLTLLLSINKYQNNRVLYLSCYLENHRCKICKQCRCSLCIEQNDSSICQNCKQCKCSMLLEINRCKTCALCKCRE